MYTVEHYFVFASYACRSIINNPVAGQCETSWLCGSPVHTNTIRLCFQRRKSPLSKPFSTKAPFSLVEVSVFHQISVDDQ